MNIKPFIIGVAGGSGSGKTTFVNKFTANFTTNEILSISFDSYYKNNFKKETKKKLFNLLIYIAVNCFVIYFNGTKL